MNAIPSLQPQPTRLPSDSAVHRLVLLRHGQSQWNLEDRFTGWTDVGLTPQGEAQARRAGELLRKWGFTIDLAFTSVLSRAVHTSLLACQELGQMHTPVERSWRLNERHYGALQGEHKGELIAKVGADQVNEWRRSYAVAPPALEVADPRHPCHDPLYAEVPRGQLPSTESLRDTESRLVPYFEGRIAPEIQAGKTVMISAHGNSLRALIKHLEGLTDRQVEQVDVPNGVPLVYELDRDLKPLRSYYLEEEPALQPA